MNSRVQVDDKGKNVECEDEGNDPFHYGPNILVVLECGGGEDDGQQDFDDDECELNPEGYAQ